MVIRKLAAGDFGSWTPLWHAYLRFYRGEVSAEVTGMTFRRLCDGLDGMTGRVARDGTGALVGIFSLLVSVGLLFAS